MYLVTHTVYMYMYTYTLYTVHSHMHAYTHTHTYMCIYTHTPYKGQGHTTLFKDPAITTTPRGTEQSQQCVCHPQPADTSRSRARNKLLVACVVALVFMVGEVLGEAPEP